MKDIYCNIIIYNKITPDEFENDFSKAGKILYNKIKKNILRRLTGEDMGNSLKYERVGYQFYVEGKYKDCRTFPQRGPIPRYGTCGVCGMTGPGDHLEHCCGPYDRYIISDNSRNEIEVSRRIQEKNFENVQFIQYRDIFPEEFSKNEKLLSTNLNSNYGNVLNIRVRSYSFSKKMQLYKNEGLIYNYSNDHKDGIPITVKVSKDNITLTHVPYIGYDSNNNIQLQSNFSDALFRELQDFIKIPFQQAILKISSMKTITNILEENKEFVIINDEISEGIQHFCNELSNELFGNIYKFVALPEKYKNSFSYKIEKKSLRIDITLNPLQEEQPFSIRMLKINIKRSGSVNIFITFGKRDDIEELYKLFPIKQTNERTFEEVEHAEVKILKKIEFILKRLSNLLPSKNVIIRHIDRSFKIDNMRDGKQPNACFTTKIMKNSIIPNVVRPVPFSFSIGVPPMRTQIIMSEGVKNKKGFYEPCCEKVKYGKTRLPKGLPTFYSYKSSEDRLKNALDSDVDKNIIKTTNELETNIKNILNSLKENSSAHKFLRRIYYGFPNEVFSGDSKEFCEIEDDNTDLKSAIFFPNTQVIDSRVYQGLESFINSENGKEEIKDFLRSILINLDRTDSILERYFYFYVEKQENRKVVLKDIQNLEEIDLSFNGEKLEPSFIISTKKMFNKLSNGIHKFAINYYLESDNESTDQNGYRINVIIRKPFQFVEDEPKLKKFDENQKEDIVNNMMLTFEQLGIEY